MATEEPTRSTTAAPNNTTGVAEVSAVVPDTAEKSVEPVEILEKETSLTQSGDASAIASSNAVAAAPGPVILSEQVPAVDVAKPVEHKAESTEPKAVAADDKTEAQQSQAIEKTEQGAQTGATKTDSSSAANPPEQKAASTPIQTLWQDAQKHAYKEIWDVTLTDPESHIPSQIIFQKYLNANDGDLVKARDQLKKTLDWREQHKPLELIKKSYASDKFGGLGYITTYGDGAGGPESKEVFTWNIYGSVKDIKQSFGDLDAFIQWRVALMEMAMHELDLNSAKKPINADYDPYKMFQVHDYMGTSFFRSPPEVRGAAKKTVEVLATAYPETLKEKFFVNVPAIMGFMYGVMKVFVAPKTAKKFHPMSNGSALVHEFGDSKVSGLGEKLPSAYGGKGAELSSSAKQTLLE